jgi:hypothetical protein
LPFLLLLFTAILMAVSVAQFALLAIMVIIPITMLSGGMGTIKSQPDTVQNLTTLRPSHHFPAFCQGGVLYHQSCTVLPLDGPVGGTCKKIRDML